MKTWLGIVLWISSSVWVNAQKLQPLPELNQRVTDLTATLLLHEKNTLEQDLAALEKAKGSQVVVVIIPTTEPEAIEQYSIRLAEAWKIGREGVDDGVILLVAKDDRKLRIEVGYGLEGAIPDIYAKRIIENIILPRFRQGDFGGGLMDGVQAISGLINKEELPDALKDKSKFSWAGIFFLLLLLSNFFALAYFKSKKMRFVAALGYFVLGWLVMDVASGFLFVFLFLFLALFSKIIGAGTTGTRRSYYSGHSHFGGGGGFSSGGGFSGGGGGSFGGGGASGGW